MFRKIRDRILTMEVVLDALIEMLHRKHIIHRDEIQLEILSKAGERKVPMFKKKFKLYEIPRGSKIYGFEFISEGGDEKNEEKIIQFNHIDGAYSHCNIWGEPEKTLHLSASTPLVKYKDGFKLDES